MTISLRAISNEELEDLANGVAPAGAASALLIQGLPPPFVARRSLEQLAGGKWNGRDFNFFMLRDVDGRIVGACGFKHPPQDGRVEVGYAVSPCCRQQGIATKAIGLLTRVAFERDGLRQVLAQIDPANIASQGVVRKLGFIDGGTVLDEDGEPAMQWLLEV
ncbi:MAG: GNAT family N-acetyltransferase [Pseudomonadota bacterium]